MIHPAAPLLQVKPEGVLIVGTKRFACTLGRGGFSRDKREGDGTTPVGCFPLRRAFYRADRVARPRTALPVVALDPADGWCDAPDDPAYNRQVRLPYRASAEVLWREDHAYDLFAVIGYNDAPSVPGRGSAIFLHIGGPDVGPTAGCVALREGDLRQVLSHAGPGTEMTIG